jgi:oligogalacturonide transport system substrate-binding protein
VHDTRQIKNRETTSRVTISWWGSDSRTEYMLKALKAYEKADAGVSVTPYYSMSQGYSDRFDMLMKADQEADVMLIDDEMLEKYNNAFLTLDNCKDLDLSSYEQSELTTGMVDGKLKAVPLTWNMMTFAYNNDILYSLDMKIPETWDDLIADGRLMQRSSRHLLAMDEESAFFMIYAYSVQKEGQEWFDTQGHYTGSEEQLKDALSFYQTLLDNGVLAENDSLDSFTSQQAAGTAAWADEIKDACTPLMHTRHNVRLGRLLSFDGNLSGWYHKPGCLYAIKADTEHKDESISLINYLIHDKDAIQNQGIDKGIPVNQETVAVLGKRGLVSGIILSSDNPTLTDADTLADLNPALKNTDAAKLFFNAYRTYGSSDASASFLQNAYSEKYPQ